MSPFEGKSCLEFFVRVAKNRREWRELGNELHRHAEVCVCPCPVCVQLRELAGKEGV